MSHHALKRLMKDEIEIKSDAYSKHFSVAPKVSKVVSPDGDIVDEKNYFEWEGVIYGPKDTPYEDGIFKIVIDVPETYPLRPPLFKFVTKIYHPNISFDGQICLDILKNAWSPVLGINKTLLSIMILLTKPNGGDPLNAVAGELFIKDREQFNAMARTWTVEYAMSS